MSKKSLYPMAGGGSSVLPKVIGTAITLAALIFVVKNPTETADFVKDIIAAISTFFDQVSS